MNAPPPGTGLGLPIARHLVQRTGGQLALHNTPDAGTWTAIGLQDG